MGYACGLSTGFVKDMGTGSNNLTGRGLQPTSCSVTILSEGCNRVNWLDASTLGLGSFPACDGHQRPRSHMIKCSIGGYHGVQLYQ